jgi:hypothetical protein
MQINFKKKEIKIPSELTNHPSLFCKTDFKNAYSCIGYILPSLIKGEGA